MKNLTLPSPFPFRSAVGRLLHLRLPILRRQVMAVRPSEPRGLQKNAIWALPHPKGARIECLSGELWITQDRQCWDVVLEPGQNYACDGSHRVLVQALQTAQFQVRPA